MKQTPRFRRAAARMLVAAAATSLLAAVPASAEASRWRGTVVAKDAQRGTFATATRRGTVRTLRASPRRLDRVRIGRRVAVRARRLADGTYAARRVRTGRRARRARVRATVVEHDHRLRRYLVSAGGSVFAIRAAARSRARAAHGGARPGDVVLVDVAIRSGHLDGRRIAEIGHVSMLELEGIFLALADGTLRVAVERRGLVEVAVPGELGVPAPAPGDQVELIVTVGDDGAFTLVALRREDEEDDVEVELDDEDGELEVEGLVTELSETSVAVQAAGAASPVACAVPAGTPLGGFAVGDSVEMDCRLLDGELVLEEIELSDEPDEVDDDEDDEDEDDHRGHGSDDDHGHGGHGSDDD